MGLLLVTCLTGGRLTAATSLFTEDFETDGQGSRYTASQPFNDGVDDHWNRTNGADISNSSAAYSGQHGSWYWAGEDVNDNGGNGQATQTMTFSSVAIAGYNNLQFLGLFAADGQISAGSYRFDADDQVRVLYRIDGGAWHNAVWCSYENLGDALDERLRRDTDFDGQGDGVYLTPAFQEFTFNIPQTGSMLDLMVEFHMDASSEEAAFDYFRLTGEPVLVNQPPAVSNSSLPNVGEPEIGETSYSFTITYSDNSAVDVSTINVADVTVTGPGGALTVVGASVAPNTDGTPRTATYTVTPPGGSWDAADNGAYSVSLVGNQVGDDGTPQLFAAAGAVGGFTVSANNTLPVVAHFLAPDVGFPQFGQTAYSFTITYQDVGGIDVSTISTADVTVTGPGGLLVVVNAVEATGTDGSPKTATYTVTPPGGSWDAADDGVYTIGLAGGQVFDVAGASVAANPTLTTFEVASTTVFAESFETDGQGVRYVATSPFTASPDDHWNRTDGSNISNTSAAYTGQDGSYYWAAEDVDDAGGNGAFPQTIDFTGINIAGHANLSFSGLFAADGNAATFDAADSIKVLYQIDGGGYQDGLWFSYQNTGDAFNEPLLRDTDFDGEGDGAQLTPAFQPFSVNLPNGAVLDLRIEVRMDAGSEEIAFDDLRLAGTVVPIVHDFGDAPTAAQSGFAASYPTTLAANGARHTIPSGGTTIFLGATTPDSDADGQPTANADGDDAAGTDDEDGVTLPAVLSGGETVSVPVTASAGGFLNGWVDFNRDGDWADAGEHVWADVPVAAGNQNLNLTAPALVEAGISFARFRITPTDPLGGLSFDGVTQDGEVEDYTLVLNAVPVPGNDTLTRYPGAEVKVLAATLLANDSDPGDALTLDSVGSPSPAGATVMLLGDYVLYQSSSSTPGSFTYEVSDTQGTTATGTVNVLIDSEEGPTLNLSHIDDLGGGLREAHFNGIPGRTYQVEFAEVLNPPSTVWTPIGSPQTADALGRFSVQHTTASPQGYYRTLSQ
ncbi:MAG: hypothetical protein H7A47_14785 [Verrucomicrobiales bacterium]|nr:hypothetical protein [Verrucomicrobiales bacterium]